MGIHQMHRSVIVHVNCIRSKAPDGSDLRDTTFSSLSLWFLKIEIVCSMWKLMREGKDTGEQRQHKRQYREKKKKAYKGI